MKIFVTGATGFLGYHFVNVAVALGHEVLCLRRSTSKSLFEPIIEEKVTWVNNDSTLKDIVCQFKPEVLFHTAWGGVRGAGRDDVNTQKANIEMSDYFYSLYPYEQIISIGSQAEYGYYQGPVLETHSLKPEMEYAKAKVISCNHLKEYCEKHNIEWQWIRIFTVFGEKQTGGLVKGFTTQCQNGATQFDTTEGKQIYSYLYSFDFAKAICQVLGTKGKSGVYNLSQPDSCYSNIEILTKIKEYLHSKIQINFGAVPYAPKQVMYMDGDVTSFESAFGKIPYTNFDIALHHTIDSLE